MSQSEPRQKVVSLFSKAPELPNGDCGATTETRQQAARKVGYGDEELAVTCCVKVPARPFKVSFDESNRLFA